MIFFFDFDRSSIDPLRTLAAQGTFLTSTQNLRRMVERKKEKGADYKSNVFYANTAFNPAFQLSAALKVNIISVAGGTDNKYEVDTEDDLYIICKLRVWVRVDSEFARNEICHLKSCACIMTITFRLSSLLHE